MVNNTHGFSNTNPPSKLAHKWPKPRRPELVVNYQCRHATLCRGRIGICKICKVGFIGAHVRIVHLPSAQLWSLPITLGCTTRKTLLWMFSCLFNWKLYPYHNFAVRTKHNVVLSRTTVFESYVYGDEFHHSRYWIMGSRYDTSTLRYNTFEAWYSWFLDVVNVKRS